ncbi:PAS domain S-box protein [Sphingomonas arenae]|uniref:PAS domain S-box protein n=1 Tax=Sphingomonas arenae TaxID=2812555 RepID=UPI001968421A|nr:PAS domain S-box protein [Sphingomonas arenae]
MVEPPALELPASGDDRIGTDAIVLGSNQLYRALLDSMSEGVSLSDEDGIIRYTNPAEDRLFGYDGGELLGQHVSVQNAYPDAENQQRVAEVIEELKAQGFWEGEWFNRRRDGSTFVSSSRITAVEVEGRRYWLCVQRDVTAARAAEREREAAHDELRRSEELQRSITNALPAIVWLATPAGELHFFNDRWYELTGQSPAEALPTGWADTLHPEDAPVTARLWAEALREGQSYENECRYRTRDGSYRWHVARAVPIRDPDGQITTWFGTSTDIHARKEAELALAESEARLRGVFNSRLTGLTIFDANSGETLAINDTFLEMTGHSRADFDEGRWDWRDFTLPEQLHLDEKAIAQARERGCWDTYEKEYRRRDGSRFPVRLASAPLPGEPGRVVVSVQDISDARAAEAELRESEQRLRLAQLAAGIGVWDWNLQSNAITWSPEMYALLDIDAATDPERLFDSWSKAVHPDDREEAMATALRGAETGEPFSMDFRVVRRNGEVCWLRSQATAVHDTAGRPIRLTGINVNVTAQHRVEEALRGKADALALAVEERTRERNRVFELSSELFAAAGFDGYLKTINPAWEKLLGYSEQELLARPFSEFIHPDDAEAAGVVVLALKKGEALQQFEDRLVRKDGQVVWVSWTAVPEGDRFYAVGRDVTRDREREEALRQSQKMEAMGQLTGGVAHDFNNLLTPIVGVLDVLQRQGLGGEREQRLIGGAAQSAERAKTLVQRLLAFARRQPLQPVAVDVGELVAGMGDLIASTTGPQIRVTVDVAPDLPPAKADPNQLEMALLNLAVNARDAMPEGGSLRISAESATVGRQHRSGLRPGRYLQLSVADTGIGMDEATLARAVEPFFSTKGVGKGTGLGLSMVHGLASQLGGAVTIRSTQGVGTNVELWLPEGQPTRSAEAPAKETSAAPGRGKVLLVDDEDLVRLSTADMLIELGYDVVEAASAEEALRLLDRGLYPEFVVTDHLMAGMSGTDLARKLQGERPGMKVLVVSGYAETAGIAADLPRLTKPFRSADLARSLAALSGPGDR